MLNVCPFQRKKPSSVKTQRAVAKKGSVFTENSKKTLVVLADKVHTLSKAVQSALTAMQCGTAIRPGKRMTLHPFDDSMPLQQECFKNDCSLFTVFNQSKKRPENVIIGRLFNFNVLDMVEFGHSVLSEDSNAFLQSMYGSKPVIVFSGDLLSPVVQRIQNLFLDVFGGGAAEKLNASGTDRVLLIDIQADHDLEVVTKPVEHMDVTVFPENAVRIVMYHVATQGADVRTGKIGTLQADARVALSLTLRRAQFASQAVFKQCVHVPKPTKTSEKGVSRDALGNLKGQVHVGKQKTEDIVHRRFKSKTKGVKRDAEGNYKKISFSTDKPAEKRKGYKIPDLAADI